MSQVREIKFGPIYRGRDVHQTPEGRSYNLTNVYRTKDGTLRKRPGYASWKDYSLARPIRKIWHSPIVTSNGIFVVRNSAASNAILDFIQSDGTTNTILNATNANLLNNIDPSMVAIEGDHIVIGAGVDLIDIQGDFTGSPTVDDLSNAPPDCRDPYGLTHARGYLFMSVNTAGQQQLTYFNNNASFSFDTAADWRSFENNRKADGLVDLFNIRDEIVSMSGLSTEFAWLDGTTPWAEIDGSYLPYGGYNLSKSQIGDSIFGMFYMDGVWRFCKLTQSHTLQDIGRGIQSVIFGTRQGTTTGSFNISPFGIDGSTFSFDGGHFYIVTDVAADCSISLVYDDTNGEWYRWGATPTTYWPLRCFLTTNWVDVSGGTGGPYILAADATSSSKIFSIDQSYKADAGSAIECHLETGPITHGTMNQKRCEWYRFYVKRVDNGSFTLYVNDENQGYDAGETVSLDPNENSEYIMAEVRNVGTYRSRQIKLVHSSATDDFELVRMEEGFTVLRS